MEDIKDNVRSSLISAIALLKRHSGVVLRITLLFHSLYGYKLNIIGEMRQLVIRPLKGSISSDLMTKGIKR